MAYSFRDHTTRKDYAMFKFNCPSCHGEIEAEDEMVGQLADCPYCGNTIEVRRPAPRLRKATPAQAQTDFTKVPPLGKLVKDGCFWLGFLLFLIGVLFAWLIKGKNGAVMALYGILFNILALFVFLIVAAIVANT